MMLLHPQIPKMAHTIRMDGLKTKDKKERKETKSNFKRIVWLVLALIMCIGMTTILTQAEEAKPSVDIISKNVYYGETLNIMFAVDAQNLSDGDEVQLVLTKDGKNVGASYYKNQTINGVKAMIFMADKGVAPQNIDDVYTAKAQIVNAGTVVAESKEYTYSVLAYLYERLYVTEGVTSAKRSLYTKLIDYATEAENVLSQGTTTIKDSVCVTVSGGTLDGGNSWGIYKAGDSISNLTADIDIPQGYGLQWQIKVYNLAGTLISQSSILASDMGEYTIPASAHVEFTATTVLLKPVEVENGLAVYMSTDGPIKIAQFADLHFGTEGANYHNNREERTRNFMKDLVETQKPDLIVCSGDNIMSTGVTGLKEFVDFMESLKTPWTFIFGNHDAEGTTYGYNKESFSDYLDSCGAEYLLYESGYVESSNNRYGNFSISVLNNDGTKLLGAVILLDTGGYNATVSSYDSITEGQIAWYEEEIDKLNQNYTGSGVVPSVVFGHIQLPEYYTAYQAARANNGATFIIDQELTSAMLASVKSGGPTNVNTGFFQTMVDKQSSVAFFCGHEHLTDFQVKMDGIVLGFGPQTGFSTIFENNDMPRKSYIYNFEKDFTFTTTSYVEKGEGLGLHYSGTFDAVGEYDQDTGTYSTTINFNYGNYILLSYDGVRLTTENTTITGDFRTATGSTKQGGFYSWDGKTFIFDGTSTNTCTFTYDPSTNTLDITAEPVAADPNAPTSVTVSSVNSDAGGNAIAVWTTAGTKIKYNSSTGEETWIGNGWRYYVVVDSEGRIAYAVYQPLSGYGGPANPTYYAHPYYTDYTKNPAIKLLDGFATDWASGGTGYNQFEIVVPEGGFAITGHGTANAELVEMLSRGAVDTCEASAVNNRSIYNSNIRLSYNSSTDTVKLTVVTEEGDSDATASVIVSTLNSDAGGDAIALWTTAGTKLKYNDASTGAENWMGNNWRYYVVVDSEGRIAYAVYQPLAGYGGPAGTSYYADPYYTDYTKNPAINLLDGFATDWGTGTGYTKFEIVVPEGGFAITGHGSANSEIVKLLSQGAVDTCDAATVNNRNVYNGNIRLSYDLTDMTVSVATVQ